MPPIPPSGCRTCRADSAFSGAIPTWTAAAVHVGTTRHVTDADGWRLDAGESLKIDVANLNQLWLLSEGGGTVSWLALR